MNIINNFIEVIKEVNKEFLIQTRYAFSLPKKNYRSMELFTMNSQQNLKIVADIINATSMKKSFDDSFFKTLNKKINLICDNVEEKKECYRDINELFHD